MSRINANRSHTRRGMTLVEIMVAAGVSAFVFAGILSTYLFVGRNLTRLVNLQEQEVASRGALRQLTADLSAAIQLTTATASQLDLTKPTATGTTTVSYQYYSVVENGVTVWKLKRTDASGTRILLKGLTAFTFTYFSEGGMAVTSSTQSVKSIEVSFSTAAGSSASGTLANYSSASARILLRNKQLLQ